MDVNYVIIQIVVYINENIKWNISNIKFMNFDMYLFHKWVDILYEYDYHMAHYLNGYLNDFNAELYINKLI